MKKKIYSLIMGICLFFAGVFSFSGCSLVASDSSQVNGSVVMKIGNTNVTKNDLVSAFYTYYQNNSSYFAYYDAATIEESFYTWYTVKTMVGELAYKELYDEETNPNGKTYYTEKDAEEVWKLVEEYFYSQVSAYEQALYNADGVKEEDLPAWLHNHEEDEAATGFSYYVKPTAEVEEDLKYDRAAHKTKKLKAQDVYEKIGQLKKDLFKYVESTDENGVETKLDIMNDALKVRNQAYANYIQSLVSSAKANGASTNVEEVLKAEVLRIYEAYYDSQINVIFQNYYVQNELLDKNSLELNDSVVVSKFLDEYYAEQQKYAFQEGYVSTMEAQDGASLVLYHYQGRNYYFSVQHILVQFSGTVLKKVQELPGYGVANAGATVYEKYINDRDDIAEEYESSILTKVNKDAEKDTLIAIGDYYYYDETKKDDPNENFGYIKLSSHSYDPTTKEVTYTSIRTYESNGETITYESDKAVKMATVDDVLEAYQINYSIWKDKADEILKNGKTINEVIGTPEEKGKFNELRYVLEVVENMKDLEVDSKEIYSKVSSLLFVELEWLYSSDSLGNEISNKIGYIVSSKDDSNMNWVVDFAVGARKMLANYKTQTIEENTTYTETVITDYGFHIMKIENVYDKAHSSIIDLKNIDKEFDLSQGSEYVEAVSNLLRKTYVCTSSNETLYRHFYDKVYATLAGSEGSAGTYFLAKEYEWLSQYYKDEKIELIKKIGYDELLDSIS